VAKDGAVIKTIPVSLGRPTMPSSSGTVVVIEKLAKTVFQIIDRINQDGVTVIIVEQNVGVLRYADAALVMEKGAIVYQGGGDELRQGDELRRTYLGAAS